jgi:HD-like signal output (HDOD) protein
MNWIARLFGGRKDPEPAAPAAPPGSSGRPAAPAGAAAAAGDATPIPLVELNANFYHWLTGNVEQAAPPTVEKVIVDELVRLAQNPSAGANLVPRVPAVIPKLLQSLRDEGVSGADLAKQLSQDVVLVAEVVREANSPYYAPTQPVKTIEGAVMLLGHNGMRMLLARVSFRPIINTQTGQHAKVVAPALWSQAEKCALAASIIAPGMQASQFEAYLAGLMKNVGLIVAFRLIDQIYPDPAVPQSSGFIKALFITARSISARIARLWDFPPGVVAAIEMEGMPDAPPLAQALALADRISKLRMLVDAGLYQPDQDPQVLAGLDRLALKAFEKLDVEL